jgi:hypothetical protein
MQEFRCHLAVNIVRLYFKHQHISNTEGIMPVCFVCVCVCFRKHLIIAHYERRWFLMSFKLIYIVTTAFQSANENVS